MTVQPKIQIFSIRHVLSLFAIWVMLISPGTSARAEPQHVRAELAQAGPPGDGVYPVLLDLSLEDGWHTYWQYPGESGLPAGFDWQGSGNLKDAQAYWPFPVRKQEWNFRVFGYDQNVRIPLELTPRNPEEDVHLALALSVLVCKDICIPQNLNLTAELSPGGYDPETVERFQNAFESVPLADDLPGLKIRNLLAGPDSLIVSVFSQSGFSEDFDAIAVAGDRAFVAPPEIEITDEREAMLRFAKPEDIENLLEYLDGKTIRVFIKARDTYIQKTMTFE